MPYQRRIFDDNEIGLTSNFILFQIPKAPKLARLRRVYVGGFLIALKKLIFQDRLDILPVTELLEMRLSVDEQEYTRFMGNVRF
jgi:hypothetical protein